LLNENLQKNKSSNITRFTLFDKVVLSTVDEISVLLFKK